MSDVAGDVEQEGDGVLAEKGGIADLQTEGRRRLPEPVVEHRRRYSSWIWALR